MAYEDKNKSGIHINNRTDKPDNIVMKEYEVNRDSEEIEKELPHFLRGVFSYFKSSLLPMSRKNIFAISVFL